MVTVSGLRAAVQAAWGPDTCDPSDLVDWRPDNPARGQCGVTALVVLELLGGDLVLGAVSTAGRRTGHHYWNRLPDGTALDLTRGQFRPGETVTAGAVVPPPTGPPRRCRGQHTLLRSRVLRHLGGVPGPPPDGRVLVVLTGPGASVLLHLRPAGDPFEPGQWSLPSTVVGDGGDPAAAARHLVRTTTGRTPAGPLPAHRTEAGADVFVCPVAPAADRSPGDPPDGASVASADPAGTGRMPDDPPGDTFVALAAVAGTERVPGDLSGGTFVALAELAMTDLGPATAAALRPLLVRARDGAVLEGIVRSSAWLLDVLAAVRDAGVPDAWVGAGALRDLVWGTRFGAGFDPGAVRDVDVAYFDPHDLGRAADDRITRLLEDRLPGVPWEARNQAAVHTWYAAKFGGDPVPPLTSIADAIGTWPETATAVVVRLDADDRLQICAPLGLTDLLDGVWRRHPRRISVERSRERLARHRPQQRWPGVRVIPPG